VKSAELVVGLGRNPITQRNILTLTQTYRNIWLGMVALILSSGLAISIFTPLEPIDYLFFALSANFNIAPAVFIIFSDLLLLLAGFLLAYSMKVFLTAGASISDSVRSLCYRVSSANTRLNKSGFASLLAASLLLAYWHVPLNLDAAVLQFRTHLIMNMSLLLAGFLIFVGAGCLEERIRKMGTIFGCKAMGIFGIYLLVTSGYSRFYSVYPLEQQAQLGLVMVVMMFLFEGILIPIWLYRYFTKPIVPLNVEQ
jgi:cytochrome c oxidase assembly factor CtaG